MITSFTRIVSAIATPIAPLSRSTVSVKAGTPITSDRYFVS